MIKNVHYADFFPYPEYRVAQENIIKQIEKNARLKKNILLVAPNGTGKTVMALSGLLPVALEKGLKIIYTCRTHAQATRVIKELDKIHSGLSDSFPKIGSISIRGRNEMCLHSTLLRLKVSSSEATSICKDLRDSNKCMFYRNVKELQENISENADYLVNRPVDAQEIIEICKEQKYCPYFLTKYLLREMTVIVCNFQWIFNPDIHFGFLKLLDMNLNQCILVIDECHNIIDVATEMNSDKLIPSFLTLCLNDLYMYNSPEEYTQFVTLIRDRLEQKRKALRYGETEIDAGLFLRSVNKKLKLGSVKKFKEFIDKLKAFHEVQRAVQNKDKTVSKDHLKFFIKFWVKWYEKRNSDKFFFCHNVQKINNRKYISLEIAALDPRDITVPIFKRSFACLNLTGTVNPHVFNSLTGLNDRTKGYKEIIATSPFKKNHIKAIITEGVNTRGANRIPATYKKMIGKIEEVISSTPANIGVFCASYKILNELVMNGISAAVKKYDKHLFIEEPGLSASKNALLLSQYKAMAKSPHKGAVLLGVCGGRNSEGEDYPGDLMNAVIIAGFPYHLSTPRTEAKIKYYNKVFRNQGWVFAYFYPAIQRANQVAGRPIRREEDKGVIVFMDSRFKDKVNWISEWIKHEIITVPDKKDLIAKQVVKFWNT